MLVTCSNPWMHDNHPVPVPVQPMIARVGLGHLLRCFRYQLSEMYGLAQLGHLKQPRLPACATNNEQASLNSLVFCGSDESWLAKQQTWLMTIIITVVMVFLDFSVRFFLEKQQLQFFAPRPVQATNTVICWVQVANQHLSDVAAAKNESLTHCSCCQFSYMLYTLWVETEPATTNGKETTKTCIL